MPEAQALELGGLEVVGKGLAALVALTVLVRYVMQMGRLIERIEQLTKEVDALRGELSEARVEIAKLRGELDGAK